MEGITTSSGTPAPYGHACASCSQSKCKCIVPPAGGPCERCYRLNRECRPAQSSRRRSSKKPIVTKKARLEEKLDGLVSLIKSGAISGPISTFPQALTSMDLSAPDNNQIRSPTANYIHSNTHSPTDSSTTYLDQGSISTTGPVESLYEPSPAEAEVYLRNFQTYKAKYFPFVRISSDTSARQLRHDQPFLWLCIMTVGSKSTPQQQILGKRIRQVIAQALVIDTTRNMDLLLGLLTFLGWANYQIHSKPFLAVFSQLAISLVFDLGLSKPVPTESQILTSCLAPRYVRISTPRTMEERRAVLGCFLITSIISNFLQKTDALRWTPHMDECLQILDETKECAHDEILVELVRLQLIAEKANSNALHDFVMLSGDLETSKSSYLDDLQSHLRDMKSRLLNKFPDNEVVLLHFYSTELEISFSPTVFNTGQMSYQQRKSINTELELIRSWFDIFFKITPTGYIGFPFSIFSQLMRCVLTLSRHKGLNGPTLNYENGSSLTTADAISILERVIDNMNQVAVLAGLDNGDDSGGDIFSRSAQLFRSIQPELQAKVQLETFSSPTALPPQNLEEFSLPDSLGMEFFDNDWHPDLFLNWNVSPSNR